MKCRGERVRQRLLPRPLPRSSALVHPADGACSYVNSWVEAGDPAPGPRSCPTALSSREPFAPTSGRARARCGQPEALREGAWRRRVGYGRPESWRSGSGRAKRTVRTTWGPRRTVSWGEKRWVSRGVWSPHAVARPPLLLSPRIGFVPMEYAPAVHRMDGAAEAMKGHADAHLRGGAAGRGCGCAP